MRVIVTRPREQAADWVARLQAAGLDAVALPLLGIGAPADPAAVAQAWRDLPGDALVVFVSPNAAERFFAQRPPGGRWPDGLRAAAPGPGTAVALHGAGLPPSRVVAPAEDAPAFDSEALWALLRDEAWAGKRVRVVRGDGGRDWLADTLRGQGAEVVFTSAYRREAPVLDAAAQALLQAAQAEPGAHLWLFSSSEAVGHLPALAPGADWSNAPALATHPRIAEAARAVGFAAVQLCAPTPDAVAAAARRWAGGTRSIESAGP